MLNVFDCMSVFWLCWVFGSTGFPLAVVSRGYSPVAVHRLLTVKASLVEHGIEAICFSSYGVWAQQM